MPAPRQLIRQHDFSSGELIEHAKRADDDPLVRAGARQLENWRILATRKVENRPGRSILFAGENRVDEVAVSSTVTYRLCFADGVIRIRNASGTIVATQGGMPWESTEVGDIRWELVNRDVVICFNGYRPIVARWDGSSAWTFHQFSFFTDVSGDRRAPFYKFAKGSVTMTPSGSSGSISVVMSDDVFTAAHVGARLRWFDAQMQITAVSDAKNATATVTRRLPITYQITLSSGSTALTKVGDAIANPDGTYTAIVVNVTDLLVFYIVQTGGATISSGLQWIGPNGLIGTTSAASATTGQAAVNWDEEVCSDARGWPMSCFVDRNRFGFCDFPQLPSAIGWSRISFYDDFLVGSEASAPIFELMARRDARVYDVIGGADEFVFTNKGVFNIPISASNPLIPGSVQFQKITDAGAARVRPTAIPEGPIYVNAGQTKVVAIVGTGQSARPYVARDVSEFHAHLFSSPVCVAVGVDAPFAEPYVFVVNDDGTMVVGRFDAGKEWVGWAPWAGEGEIEWASASGGSSVLLTTKYTPDATAIRLCEQIDTATYLDANVTVASIPSALDNGTDSDILLYPSGGTRIGDLTAAGGLAAAFDGTTSQAAAAAASKTSATSGYVGKTLDVAQTCKKVKIYPSSNNGFSDQATVTITLYGKQGTAPANATDGTSLGTTGSISDTTSMQTINSSNTATEYDHLWVTITQSSGIIYVAEVQFYTPGLTRAAPGGGTDDLWFLAGATVRVMDGLRDLGPREVSAAGVLEEIEGEDLSGEDIAVGFAWTATLEPFLPHIPSGQSHGQTIDKRGVGHFAVAFQQSTGFLVQKSDGTSARRVAPFAAGDNQDGDPPQREGVETFSIAGQEHDHRIQVVKDTPGTLRILELSTEI